MHDSSAARCRPAVRMDDAERLRACAASAAAARTIELQTPTPTLPPLDDTVVDRGDGAPGTVSEEEGVAGPDERAPPGDPIPGQVDAQQAEMRADVFAALHHQHDGR